MPAPARLLRSVAILVALAVLPAAARAVCPDGVVQPPEECDDGNATSGDGCFESCHLEDALVLGGLGTDEGGAVKLWVFGQLSTAPASAGATPNQVLTALAAAVNANTTLSGLGVSAVAIGNRLVTNGTISGVDIKDPGLVQCAAPVPASSTGALALLAALLVMTALWWRRAAARG